MGTDDPTKSTLQAIAPAIHERMPVLTVAKLIERLQALPPGHLVFVENNNEVAAACEVIEGQDCIILARDPLEDFLQVYA